MSKVKALSVPRSHVPEIDNLGDQKVAFLVYNLCLTDATNNLPVAERTWQNTRKQALLGAQRSTLAQRIISHTLALRDYG